MKLGDKVGRYELEELLGEGAMGQVFAARQPLRDKRLALKILRREASADEQYVARFLGDARAADALDHPNIIRIIDVEATPEATFIVMELVEGASLDVLLKERGRLEIDEAARLARDVASALAAAHEKGIVHRDVKPSNILVDARTGAAKLTDFGAAKRVRSDGPALSYHGQLIGTPQYMAPEQIEGRPVTAQADLFALGATLHEMLAGTPAFQGDSLAGQLHAVVFEVPQPVAQLRPEVPAELAALIGRLLAKSPEARPDSAAAVAAALAPFTVPTVLRQGGGERKTTRPWTLPRRPALVAGGAALCVLLLGLWWTLVPPRPKTTVDVPDSPPAGSELPVAEASPGPQGPTTAPSGQGTAPSAERITIRPNLPMPASAPDRAAVERALIGTPCVSAKAEVAPDGRVRVGGNAATRELAAEVTEKVGAVAGVEGVENGLELLPSPSCAAAVRIERAVGSSPAMPAVSLNKPDGVYLDKEYLVLEAAMPPDLGGFLYIDLLTDSGSVVHLLPEPMRPDNALPPGGRIRIGVKADERAPTVRHWQAGPPFSSAYHLLLIATERPLYAGVRPLILEPLEPYVLTLLDALGKSETGRKAVRTRRLEFRPGSGG